MEDCTSLSRAQLKQALIDCKYFHIVDTERDVLEVIATFNCLKITTDTHVSNTGLSQRLVCIKGTIPVDYKGVYYHIPLCIWLCMSHPTLPPFVYIRPTKTMALVTGPHVDQAGLVTHPYLDNWDKDRSDLSSLVQILCAVFAESIPVITKKQGIPQAESSEDNRARTSRERVGSDKEQTQFNEKTKITGLSRLGTDGSWLGTNRERFQTDVLASTGGERVRADGLWTKPEGTFSRGKGTAAPHTINSSVSSVGKYIEEKSKHTPKESTWCDQLRKKRESLLHTIDDVITKAKVLRCEAETIVTILETSKSNLMKESFSLESLNGTKNNVERTPRWQKGLAFTLEDVGNMAERVIIDIEDYAVFKGQEEPRGPIANKAYMDWSTDELCIWFASIGFSECIPFVKEHRLRGAHLPDLTKDDMIELGIKKLGDRITIDNEINKLCSTVSNLFS